MPHASASGNGSGLPQDSCACGRRKPVIYPTCWRCKSERELEAAYQAGYEKGYDAGYDYGCQVGFKSGKRPPQLDSYRVRQLLQLCHPDRHAGSATANEITTWLLSQRDSAS